MCVDMDLRFVSPQDQMVVCGRCGATGHNSTVCEADVTQMISTICRWCARKTCRGGDDCEYGPKLLNKADFVMQLHKAMKAAEEDAGVAHTLHGLRQQLISSAKHVIEKQEAYERRGQRQSPSQLGNIQVGFQGQGFGVNSSQSYPPMKQHYAEYRR